MPFTEEEQNCLIDFYELLNGSIGEVRENFKQRFGHYLSRPTIRRILLGHESMLFDKGDSLKQHGGYRGKSRSPNKLRNQSSKSLDKYYKYFDRAKIRF